MASWRLVAISLALGFPGWLPAQVVTGRVLETGTREGVPWVALTLIDTTGVQVTATLSDSSGAFELRAPAPGDYFVRAARLGYREVVDGILELGTGGRMSVEVFLRPVPVDIGAITVAAERNRTIRYLEEEGFYRRMNVGAGKFLTPEDIDKAGVVFDLPALLNRIPFVERLDRFGRGATVQLLGRGGRCIPRIFVDAIPVPSSVRLDHYVIPEEVLAVEVYRGPAEIPIQWGGMQRCGVVLVWTIWGRTYSGR